jgi:myosin tail region-interacting protein MTI1
MVDEPDEFVDVGKDDGREEVPAPQEEEHDAPPPLPPSRPVKRTSGSSHGHGHAPGRAVPPPPPAPAVPTSASAASATGMDWELPNIPGSDLEMSWSSDADFLDTGAGARDRAPTSDDAPPPPPAKRASIVPASTAAPISPANERDYTPDELMAIWGKVGVHLAEVASILHDKSKKSLIGDGSYHGFVQQVIGGVGTALPPNRPPTAAAGSAPTYTYGYLIYAQTGPSISKRITEILPGDILVVSPGSRFKGRHGLQTYQQVVGNEGVGEEWVVGVVSEFEGGKKFKAKVLQANQKVGQATTESVSYRLEDLKSGSVKVGFC